MSLLNEATYSDSAFSICLAIVHIGAGDSNIFLHYRLGKVCGGFP